MKALKYYDSSLRKAAFYVLFNFSYLLMRIAIIGLDLY